MIVVEIVVEYPNGTDARADAKYYQEFSHDRGLPPKQTNLLT